MSIFVKIARICLFIAAVSCATTFADERPGAFTVAVAVPSVGITGDQDTFEKKWDDRGLPQLASLTVSAPDSVQEPAVVDPEPAWQQAMRMMLDDTSAKWAELQSRILADKATLAACRSGGPCPAAARRFLSIVELARQHQGRARFGQINRAINMSIRPMSDLAQYGVDDYWASPLTALGNGAGDCEDYAIAKYVALQESGIAQGDLRLEIVRDVEHQATHAVVAVRYEQQWLILDNRTLVIVKAEEARSYVALFALDQQGVRTMTPEVFHHLAVQAGDTVSYLQDDRTTDNSTNLAIADRPQKAN